MRKFGKEKSSQEAEKRVLAAKEGGEGSWIKRHWLPLTLLMIVALAVAVRTVFSFGISAGSNFALSGAGSSEHQHTIESILTGAFGLSDPSLNYPYGGTSVQPPLVDFILAFFAEIAVLLGVSVPTAAAGALAFSGPVAAAITCVLVYMLGKEMFDRTVGIVSALLFATLPLPIVMSVFSNGSEMSIVLLFFVAATLFMFKAMSALDGRSDGIRGAFAKEVLKYTVPAGLLIAAVALSWNGFRMVIVMLVFLMVAQAVFARLRDRDFGAVFAAYLTVIAIGLAVSVPYYVAAGLFFAVFTGPVIVAAVSAACVGTFYLMRSRPKIQSFIVPIMIAVAVMAALYLASPRLFEDAVSGNQIYETSLIAAILLPQHVSISYMATFYGWATVWMPFVIFTYMLYRFGRKGRSEAYLMSMLWIIGVFVLSWLSSESAIMAGAMYSIAASAVIVKLIRTVDMRTYLSTIRGGGFKASIKKFLKPEPFISLVCVLLLVVAPNAVLAADASISTNQEEGLSAGYLGGIGYSINTDESNSMNMIWDAYSGTPKDGALVTWFLDSSSAVDRGGFVSVTSDSGQGASAASNIILANGSEGAYAAMALRLIMADGADRYSDQIDAAGLDGLASFIDNPASCRSTILKNPDLYTGISGSLSDENAIYIRAVQYITEELTETEVIAFYNDICDERGDGGISYVALNAGMIPLYYGDGSSISTLGYLNDYSTDSYGAVTKYFSYGYSGVTYTDAMYESFLWKALFGVTDESAGVTQSIAYELVYSDGTVTAQPGLGLSGFDVVYWQVKYNPDDDASLNDSGWTYMDGYEAIELQKANGGLINYFSSVVLLKVSDAADENAVTGQITYNDGTPMQGAKVAVFEKDGNGMFVQRSTSFTDSDGNYSIMVPASGNYEIRVYTGTDLTVGGTFVGTVADPSVATDITGSTISGTVTGAASQVSVTAVGKYSGKTVTVTADVNGNYIFPNMPSDKYTITATLGTYTLGTKTVTIYPDANAGVNIEPEGKISVTVTDQYGAPQAGVQVVAQSLLDGTMYTAVTDVYGKAVISVMRSITGVDYSGQYIVYAKDKVGTSYSAKVSSTSTVNAKISVYGDVKTVEGMTGIITVTAPGYSSVNASAGKANLPDAGDSVFTLFDGSAVKTYAAADGTYADIGSAVSFTARLLSSSGDGIAGKVTFFGSNGVTMGYAADEDGNISGKLPAGEYTMYAVGTDGSCLITSVTVADGTDLGEIKTQDGRKLTVTLTFSSGTDGQKGVAFREVKVTLGDGQVIYGTTNSEGKATMQIPDGVTAEVLIAGFDDLAMSCSDLTKSISAGTESATATFNIGTVAGSTVKAQRITVEIEKNTWLMSSSSSTTADYEIAAGASADVEPGTYYRIEENGSVYTYSKVSIYAGHTEIYTVADTEAAPLSKVEIPVLTGATVTVTADPDNGDAEYYKVNLGTGYYLLESGKKYLFKAETDTQVAYAYYGGSSLDNPNWTLEDAVTLKGYVGVSGSGTATITSSSQTIFTTVTDGVYKTEVPAAIGDVTIVFDVAKTISSSDYSYTGTVSATIDPSKASTVNAQLTGDGLIVADPDADLTISVDSTVPSADGRFFFIINVTPSADSTGTKTYAVVSSGPWQLDSSYTVTVYGPDATTVEVWGWLDPLKVGDGNPEMKVSLADLEGTTQATCRIPGGYVVDIPSSDNVTIMVATDEGASPDAVNDYEYMYAVTVRSEANYLMYAKLTVTGVPAGWLYTVSDADGKLIDPTAEFPVAGYADTTIYVKLINADGSDAEVPGIHIDVEVLHGGSPVTTDSFDVTKQDAVLDSSVSASGDNVYQTGNAVQDAFWVLLVLSAILIVMIIWLGSKRGVFRRKK